MESAIELSSNLISLEDGQLDDVAGGCGGRGRGRWGRGGRGHGRAGGGPSAAPDVNVDVDVNVVQQTNVINFVGNTIVAGGDVTLVFDQSIA